VKYPSFEDLVGVIRDSARLKKNIRIDPDTQICRDLDISGKAGIYVLKAIEGHYGIGFNPEIFDRIESGRQTQQDRDETPLIQPLLGSQVREEHPITAGQLYKVILQELRGIPEYPPGDHQAI
jgi:acyl-[acyl carrier protein]--UDP-N-acetylglucosamine O-acyltransferase